MCSLIPILRTSKGKEKRGSRKKSESLRNRGVKLQCSTDARETSCDSSYRDVRTNESSKNPDFAKLCKIRILKCRDRNYHYLVQLCLSRTTLIDHF